MKTQFSAILLALAAPIASADILTQVDREALLEKLEQIHEAANSKVDSRYKAALSAYKAAMSSNDAALELYLRCEEMVSFDEMNKKSGDFREWKRKNADRLTDNDFKSALRLQLRWLVLTLESTSEDADMDVLSMEASKVMDAIYADAEDLGKYRRTLQQGVTESVFARAYDLNGFKAEKWPVAPAALKQVFDQVILPPLRRSDRISALRASWTKRMQMEAAFADYWTLKPEEKLKSGEHTPEYDKFILEVLPDLQWESEVDQFKAGDERGAAVRMLEHIEKNIVHESAPKWASELTTMLAADSPKKTPVPAAPKSEESAP
ncbi:hypothetical protein ACFSSA_07610 [Luteolibacter algae]|uniref:Uncharacterized protein n=1 Tax=Luteolibacter algae TaxID=454151 RepID=A0ABW5D657_9BACT